MELNRVKSILNNDEKFDIYYDERLVWIQGLNENNETAKVGFVDDFEEKRTNFSNEKFFVRYYFTRFYIFHQIALYS